MSEYIKRDDVIDLLEQVLNAEEFFDTDNAKAQSDLALWFEERISELPKADVVEVRHGHWIRYDDLVVSCECSVCGEKFNLYEDDVFGYPYCPNCGAKMDGKEQEHV